MAGVSLGFCSSPNPAGPSGSNRPVYRSRARTSRKERRPDLCPDSLARVLGRPHGHSVFRICNGFCRYDGRGDELAAMVLQKQLALTTSTALTIVGFAGILCGQGHIFTPVVVGVI